MLSSLNVVQHLDKDTTCHIFPSSSSYRCSVDELYLRDRPLECRERCRRDRLIADVTTWRRARADMLEVYQLGQPH